MATATPNDTPNPNAKKFALDITLPEMFNISGPDDAAGNAFAAEVFAAGGIASLFGVNDFVTVTREADADWDSIIAAVTAAAAAHL
ncbi:MAG: NifU N-terminal domain-containing protein [Actinomycetota bacterium]